MQLRIEKVENLQIISGDGVMDQDRTSISISGNVTGSNINTGDGAVQKNEFQRGVSEQAFVQLFRDISEKCTGETCEQMQFFAEKLQEAYRKEDKEEGKKLLGFLQKALGNIASVASIASLFGIVL